MNYLANFLIFVVQIVFGILIFVVMARFLLQLVRADFYNPISQMFIKFTTPLLNPLRAFIPGFWGLDIAALVLLLILQSVELLLTHLIGNIGLHGPLLFMAEIIGTLIQHAAILFLICIFIVIFMSWVSPGVHHHPVVQIAFQLSSPILRPARKILKPINDIDFSPILAVIFIFAILFLVAAPLIDLPHVPRLK